VQVGEEAPLEPGPAPASGEWWRRTAEFRKST